MTRRSNRRLSTVPKFSTDVCSPMPAKIPAEPSPVAEMTPVLHDHDVMLARPSRTSRMALMPSGPVCRPDVGRRLNAIGRSSLCTPDAVGVAPLGRDGAADVTSAPTVDAMPGASSPAVRCRRWRSLSQCQPSAVMPPRSHLAWRCCRTCLTRASRPATAEMPDASSPAVAMLPIEMTGVAGLADRR